MNKHNNERVLSLYVESIKTVIYIIFNKEISDSICKDIILSGHSIKSLVVSIQKKLRVRRIGEKEEERITLAIYETVLAGNKSTPDLNKKITKKIIELRREIEKNTSTINDVDLKYKKMRYNIITEYQFVGRFLRNIFRLYNHRINQIKSLKLALNLENSAIDNLNKVVMDSIDKAFSYMS